MNVQAALSSLKSAPTLEAASVAYQACLAAPDLEEAADWAAHKYAQKREALEAQARHDALKAERVRLMAHKRERIAALESEVPTAARQIQLRILRAEVAFGVIAQEGRTLEQVGDALGAIANWQAGRDALDELARAKWARRCYRLKTGGHGPLGAMTREDHLMRYPG